MSDALFPGSLAASMAGAAAAWSLATLLGASALPRDEPPDDDAAMRLVSWAVTGFGIIGVLALLGSLAHVLTPGGVLIATGALLAAAAALSGRRVLRATLGGLRHARRTWGSASPVERGGAIALMLVPALAVPFSIVTSVHYDDMVYHLGLPRQALIEGSWPAWPHFHHALMPAAWETSYLIPLAMRGGVGPQIENLLAVVALAWVTFRLARRGGGRLAACIAATLVMSSGVIVAFAWTAGNDLYVGLALATAVERTLARRPLEAAGCAGAACAAKYTAWLGTAALGSALAASGRRSVRPVLAIAVAWALLAGPWCARAAMLTGNPVYPTAFRTATWDDTSAALMARDTPGGSIGEAGPSSVVTGLRRVLTAPGAMGVPSGLSRAFLVLALCGLALARRVRDAGTLLIFVGVSWLAWSATSMMLRFLVAALVVLSPFAAAAIEILLSRARAPGRRAAVAAALALCVSALALDVKRHYGALGLSPWALPAHRTEFLPRVIALAAISGDMDARLPEDARIVLVAEARTALIPRRVVPSSALDRPALHDALEGATSDADVSRRLAALGTHVLINANEWQRWDRGYQWSERIGPEAGLLRAWLQARRPLLQSGPVAVYETSDTPAP